jgi:hypothetical protein
MSSTPSKPSYLSLTWMYLDTKIYLDTSILETNNSSQREYSDSETRVIVLSSKSFGAVLFVGHVRLVGVPGFDSLMGIHILGRLSYALFL